MATLTADELLRRKVKALMDHHHLTQIDLAQRLQKSQAWLSRRLTGVQRFQVRDLDHIVRVFGITIPELFFDVYGQWDRRSGSDRRKGERRKTRQTIYDPSVEPSRAISRIAFHDDERGEEDKSA